MLNIYIVSLKQDVEKRSTISKKLEEFGLKFRFIDAVHGKEISDDVLSSLRNKSVGGILERGYSATAGEIGCTLSHQKAYQKLLDSNLNWACVLEDDVILDESFKTFITTFQDNNLDPETLYILGGQNGFSQMQVIKSLKNHVYIGGQNFTKVIKSDRFITRSCCYLISSDLAENFIRFSERNFIVADDWYCLSKNGVLKNIYLADFVNHPVDLSTSNLEEERKLKRLEKRLNDTREKKPLFIKIKNAISSRLNWRLRLLSLSFYKYIERKE